MTVGHQPQIMGPLKMVEISRCRPGGRTETVTCLEIIRFLCQYPRRELNPNRQILISYSQSHRGQMGRWVYLSSNSAESHRKRYLRKTSCVSGGVMFFDNFCTNHNAFESSTPPSLAKRSTDTVIQPVRWIAQVCFNTRSIRYNFRERNSKTFDWF